MFGALFATKTFCILCECLQINFHLKYYQFLIMNCNNVVVTYQTNYFWGHNQTDSGRHGTRPDANVTENSQKHYGNQAYDNGLRTSLIINHGLTS